MFNPVWDNILVRDIDPVKVTKSGLALPDTHQGDVLKAEILAIGPGPFVIQQTVKVDCPFRIGQVVLIHKNAGIPFTFEEQEFRTLPAYHVLGVEV